MSERERETDRGHLFRSYPIGGVWGKCAPKIQLELQVCFLANCMHTHAYSTARLGTQLLCLAPAKKVKYTRRLMGLDKKERRLASLIIPHSKQRWRSNVASKRLPGKGGGGNRAKKTLALPDPILPAPCPYAQHQLSLQPLLLAMLPKTCPDWSGPLS